MSFRRYARGISCVSRLLVGAALASACSSGNDAPTPGATAGTGAGGASGGTNAVAGGSAGVSPVGGSAGAAVSTGGSSVAGTSGTGASGASGAATGGTANGGAATGGTATGGGGSSTGGSTAGGGSGGQGGATSCAGNAISLSANGTGTDSDAAAARIVIDMMTDLPLGNSNRTIEFWADIKPTDWVGESNELYAYGANTNAAAFGLDFGTFSVKNMPTNHATLNPVTGGGFNDDSTNDLGITSATRQWVHIAMVWDGTAIKTYVNGALKITSPGMNGTTMLATAASPITFGYSPANKNCFNGSFDELRIWKAARTDAEISSNYNKNVAPDDPNLVGYWKFDEAPGATMAADSVTTAGHTPHPGVLTSAMPAGLPTFVTPMMPAPIHCR